MAIEIKPKFQIALDDDDDALTAGMLTPSRHNQGSDLTLAVQRLIGRVQEDAETSGAAQEIEVLAGLILDAAGLAIDKASAANWRARAADKALTADGMTAAKAPVALDYASTLAIDWKAGWCRTCTLTGNPTLGNPTNVEPGDTIILRFIGDSATERSISLGSNFVTEPPEDTVTNAKGLVAMLWAASATEIHALWWGFEP